jgi:hypothetical protein
VAAALPGLLRRADRWRPVSVAELRQTFLDPFAGKPRARLWERIQAPPPAAPGPGTVLDPTPIPGPAVKPGAGAAWPAPRPPVLSLPDPSAADLLSDPTGSLDHFHAMLARTERGEATTRIVHFGDSVVTGDLISGEARARLQRIYGDGGPGWIYLQRPWEWYGRLGLSLKGHDWRIQSPVLNGRPDHRYGLAGLAFSSAGGAETRLSTAASQPFDRVELHFLTQPKGGSVQVQVDHTLDLDVQLLGEGGPASKTLALPTEDAHVLTLRPKGEAVLYGVVLERSAAGVVYDPLGQNGYAIQHLARIDSGHWMETLRLRRPDLVVLAFGTNEVGYYNIPGPAYAADYREVVRRIRAALPATSILVMGPMDRGERREDGGLGTMPNLIRIVAAQKRIAAELGVAFFDTYRAMGGEGSAARGYGANPRLMTGDFTHPTRTGADRIAKSFVDALLLRQQAWQQARPEAGDALAGGRSR